MSDKRYMFRIELELMINKHGIDAELNTPDFILAEHLVGSLDRAMETINRREQWFGRGLRIGGIQRINPETGASEGFIEDAAGERTPGDSRNPMPGARRG